MDAMDIDYEEQPRVKRFKHQSYNEILKDVHPTAAHNQQRLDLDVEDNDSNFHQALEHWRQLNLAPSFISFANKADSLSTSMPLLLHNWKEITDLWIAAFGAADDEGLRALLDLLQKLAHDLRTTLSPIYSSLLTRLLTPLSRAISPPALQALLDTLGALFKYLLVPSTNMELLKQTWTAFHETLPRCLPEIQRAAAEVWGNVLRRFKTSMREAAVTLLAESSEGIEDASAWAVVSACKSVSQTLHTATGSIMSTILNYHLTTDDSNPTFTLLRRVLTALIHHVKKAEQFTPLADLLIKQFTTYPKSLEGMDEAELEKLRRWLEILTIPCAVRQGSRLNQNQLAQISAELAKIPITPAIHASLLRFTTAVFTASEMQLWLGPGYKFLQRVWSQCSPTSSLTPSSKDGLAFALDFNTALAELNWGGWKLVALPQLLKATSSQELLDAEPRRMARFLAAVRRCKKVNEKDADLVWRERVGGWVRKGLEEWEGGDIQKETELDDLLAISAMFSGVMQPIVGVVERIMDRLTLEGGEHGNHGAWVVGACMQGLLKRGVEEWDDKVDLTRWTRTCLSNWGGESEILGGLYALAQASPTTKRTPIPLEELYPHLQTSLLSHSRALRLSALRLLGSTLVQLHPGMTEVVKRCLQGEEVPLDVQGVRERVLRIGRLGPMLKDGDEIGADVSVRWLIAQLKVNLRPIWSPASGALSSLSERFGDIVWKLVFQEIIQLRQERKGISSGMSDMDVDEVGVLDNVWEEERSWRDPSAHTLREVVGKTLNEKYAQIELLKSQTPRDRLDLRSYETQLLATLRECSSLAEKHNRELVPYFLSIASPDVETKIPRSSLSAWLTLFSKFTNPKALYSTDILLSLWYSLLSHPDRSLQQISLSCLFTYKSPRLLSHQEKLRSLLDETRWRDELTSLDFSAIDPQDRAEFVDVTIRLLFGIMLEKKGRSRGADRRAAVLNTLAGCTTDELGLLIDLMLQPLNSARDARREEPFVIKDVAKGVSDKQQTGFLNLLGDVLKNLGSKLVPYWPALIGVAVDLVAHAQQRIGGTVQEAEGEDDEDDTGDDNEGEGVLTPHPASKVVRSIRQYGLKRFADFFRQPVRINFTPFVSAAYPSFISPRLTSLDVENTQAPSALLELCFVWSCEEDFVQYLWKQDPSVLPKIYGCLVATSVKPAVIMRVFDIVDHLLGYCEHNATIREEVVKPHVSLLLTNLGTLIQQTKGTAVATPLAQRQIRMLSEIAQYCTNSQQAATLLTLLLPLLRRPSKLVSEKIKTDLLKTVANLIPQTSDLSSRDSEIYDLVYRLLSSLFTSLRTRFARSSLVSAFQALAAVDTELQSLAGLLSSLNAYSVKRMDEPDFEIRLKAFIELNDTAFRSLTCSDWLPILHNMLHHIQDPEELTIRNNASLSMRHFINIVSAQPGSHFEEMFSHVLYPGIKNTLHSKYEMVRSEVLGVLAYAVQKCDGIQSLQEMKVLLANGDDEANFFNNILHVQLHRRSRALRRLAEYCDEGHLRSSTLDDIFVPLIGFYIVNPSTSDHHLVNDAIVALGRTARHLNWGAYYNLVQKYLKLSRAKDESERLYVRTLVSLLDNFHFLMEETVQEPVSFQPDDEVDNGTTEPDVPDDAVVEPVPVQTNVQSAKHLNRVSDAVNTRLLPSLLNHLETHNADTDDNARIPISIGIVTVAKHLPEALKGTQITRLITILSQILRSKSQETRDLVRDALCRIAVALGPSFLPLMFKEMRAALLRGPQLHVLAYVVHAIIVHVTSGDHASSFTTLDDCVNDVAFVSAEVIFGESGKDVQSEDFKTKMREVRTSASKGLDSFATVSKYITPLKISSLLAPLKSIMQETGSLKVMNLAEEVLKRTAGGLNSNEHLTPSELLVLCNTLISQNARFLRQTQVKGKKGLKGDAIVQLKRHQEIKTDHYSNNSYRFVAFGLELFQTALRRNRFDFHDAQVMSRLDAMVAVIGNTLYSTNASVLITASRCAANLAKCPLQSLNKSIPVYVTQLLDILRHAGNTESELAQAALKSLATILRDGPAVQVKEKDLVFLLELVTPELEEPERQTSAFSMLRAIVAGKFVVPEIYDTMDKVSEIMVTSQSPQVQELSRGVLLQFLLDYPQGKGRFRKQMTFLAQNLSYVHESGRRSVMELLGAVIAKFQENLIREYGDLLFVALVIVVANDDSPKCREMAAALIKSLFVRLDDEQRRTLLSHLHSWASQADQPQLSRVSSQVYGFIVDILQEESRPYIGSILEDLHSALARSTQQMDIQNERNEEGAMQIDLDWQGPYNALIVLSKTIRVFSDFIPEDGRIHWEYVVSHLLFPHAWVRLAACRLLGTLFSSIPVQPFSKSRHRPPHPLSKEGMQQVVANLTIQLKSEHLDEQLGLQVVKNLFYIGKCFLLQGDPQEDTGSDEEPEGEHDPNDTVKEKSLPWLFSNLSYQIRSAQIARRNRQFNKDNWHQRPLSALRWFAAMASHMEAEQLERFLTHILSPVYRLLEEDIIRDSLMDELKTLATELQDLVQSKVGTTKFSAVYNQIRQNIVGVRRERKNERAVRETRDPEAAAKRRISKNTNKKESKKRKHRLLADMHGKFKRRRQD